MRYRGLAFQQRPDYFDTALTAREHFPARQQECWILRMVAGELQQPFFR